jgi:hypothetical protein
MSKTLQQFLEVYRPKSADEQKFVDKHVTVKNKDRNGNGDDVFKATNVKVGDRKNENHGYDAGEDEKVYEEDGTRIKLTKGWGDGGKSMRANKGKLVGNQHKIDANKNGKVDAHDFKLLRNKKKVAEEAEELDESWSDGRFSPGSRARSVSLSRSIEYARKAKSAKDTADAHKPDSEGRNIHMHKYHSLMAKAHKEAYHADKGYTHENGIGGYSSVDDAKKRYKEHMAKAKEYKSKLTEEVELDEGTTPALNAVLSGHSGKTYGDIFTKHGDKIHGMMAAVRKERADVAKSSGSSRPAMYHDIALKAYNSWKKNTNEEVEQIDEISAMTKDAYAQKAGKQLPGLFKKSKSDADAARTYYNRKNTVRKIANEEAEELDELSQKMVRAYRDKARDDKESAEDDREFYKAMGDNTSAEDKKIRKRTSGIRMAGKKIYGGAKVRMGEETEELDEISKKTLGNYAYRAASELGSRGITTGLKIAADEPTEKNFKKMGNRQRGVARAVAKLTKEEVDQLDELSPDLLVRAHDKALSNANAATARRKARGDINPSRVEKKNDDRIGKFAQGERLAIRRDAKKMSNEEVDQIDELSKGTMGSYINKAKDAIDTTSWRQGYKEAGAGNPSGKLEKKLTKRHKGISMAVKKLTKEEVEEYFYDITTEANADLLMSVFEQLGEDNQDRFLEACQTPDGVDAMLDFSIKNRNI